MVTSRMFTGGSRLRRFARHFRHTPDRLLHSIRRRRAMQDLRAEPPRSVLVLCLGNICRSPYAAASLARCALNGLEVRSAGFLRSGRPSPETARSSAQRNGIDLSGHRSQQVTPALLEQADLVIVMDRGQRGRLREQFGRRTGVLVLGDLDPEPIDTRTIRDPFDQSDEVFDQVYARIDRCVGTLKDCV